MKYLVSGKVKGDISVNELQDQYVVYNSHVLIKIGYSSHQNPKAAGGAHAPS